MYVMRAPIWFVSLSDNLHWCQTIVASGDLHLSPIAEILGEKADNYFN